MASSFDTTGKWLSRLAALAIVFLSVVVTSGEQIHAAVLEFGEEHRDEYFLLRGAGSIQPPDCERNPDVNKRVQQAIREKKKQLEGDPLTEVFGTAVNKTAVHKEVLASRKICREKWQRYEKIQKHLQQRLTTKWATFIAIEKGLEEAVVLIYPQKRSMLAFIILLCAATSTFQRRYISVLPVETRTDHRVHSLSMVITNGFLAGAALSHHLEIQALEDGDVLSLGLFWVPAFTLLMLASLYRLLSPPADLVPGGSYRKALLCVPLFSLLCLLASFLILSQGVRLATSIFLAVAQEEGHASFLLQFLLVIWIAIWLVNRVEASAVKEKSGPPA